MRTNSNQAAIVALSFSPLDFLAVGPIASIRFTALCRGKRRVSALRSVGRRVQAVIDSIGLAFCTVFSVCWDVVRAGGGYVSTKAKAGYDTTRDGVSYVSQAVATQVGRAWGRVSQVGHVLVMYLRLYGLFGVSRRAEVPMGWTMIAADVTAPEPVVEREPTPVVEPEPVAVVETPVVALAHSPIPMTAACRVTQEDEGDDDKTTLLNKAKALMADGNSQRATAKALGLSESTLRTWLKKAK